MSIFQDILACRSFTAITYMAEDALADAPKSERATLQRILQANKLDEMYALAHDHLGQHEQAKALREFLAARKPRVLDSELAAMLDL